MFSPLYIKYRTDKNAYLYDAGTGEIIEVDDVVYSIIDDYGILSEEKIIDKHYGQYTTEELKDALIDIENNCRDHHVLLEHPPTETDDIGGVIYKKKQYSIDEFVTRFNALLVLELTERCNLRCDYCCYGDEFGTYREHGTRSMSEITALAAVNAHVHANQGDGNPCAVSFYGGEPLLEFPLLKKAVEYAENEASSLGKEILFNITTNGTLLDNEKTKFLVEHNFLVLISLDGPKEAHDRYRVFAQGRHGSFDVVMRNVQRFDELYPHYKKRGLSMTIAPPLLWDVTNELLLELLPAYPFTRVALVNIDQTNGLHCLKDCEHPICGTKNSKFRFYTDDEKKLLREKYNDYIYTLQSQDATGGRDRRPLASLLFDGELKRIHQRLVTSRPPKYMFAAPCIPGFTRRFCDIHGNYHVCERVDGSDRYVIGNVMNGIDPVKVKGLMKWHHRTTSCGDCYSAKICPLCYAAILDADTTAAKISHNVKSQCDQCRSSSQGRLREYTQIMEKNPSAFFANQSARSFERISFLPENPQLIKLKID